MLLEGMKNGHRFIAVGVLTLFCLGLGAGPAAAADSLPDLGMARLADFHLDSIGGGRKLLRYSTTITNTGAGAFELHGQRAQTSDPQMSVVQKIYNDGGGSRQVSTAATMYFALWPEIIGTLWTSGKLAW